MAYLFTNQKDIRRAFRVVWDGIVTKNPGHANDKPMQRQAFADWIDYLAREGEISEALAGRATLGK